MRSSEEGNLYSPWRYTVKFTLITWLLRQKYVLSLSLTMCIHPVKKQIYLCMLRRISQHNRRGLNAALQSTGEKALRPNHIRSHNNQEKHIVDSLIENMWKAHYQKDLLQSLKQNASIKYILYCFQVLNKTHDVFIKCNNKNQTSRGRWWRACGAKMISKTSIISILAEYWWNTVKLFPPQTIQTWATSFYDSRGEYQVTPLCCIQQYLYRSSDCNNRCSSECNVIVLINLLLCI